MALQKKNIKKSYGLKTEGATFVGILLSRDGLTLTTSTVRALKNYLHMTRKDISEASSASNAIITGWLAR